MGFLVKLREFESSVDWGHTTDNIRTLRTNGLRTSREMRDAALFCVGMSIIIDRSVRFAPVEADDHDFMLAWQDEGTQHFCPVQLKEVATHRNPSANVEDVLSGLTKYTASGDLVVAIKLNSHFDPGSVSIPDGVAVGGIWFFGSVTPDQSEWAIWGDFNDSNNANVGLRYSYPTT